MAYRVDISRPAIEDAETAYLWMREHSPEKAANWFAGLMDAIFSLEKMPDRCPIAPESREFAIEVRQLLYGKRRNVYRVLFSVTYDNEADENVIRIYRIRHAAQRRLKDLELLGENAEEDK